MMINQKDWLRIHITDHYANMFLEIKNEEEAEAIINRFLSSLFEGRENNDETKLEMYHALDELNKEILKRVGRIKDDS